MKWIALNNEELVDQIKEESKEYTIMIFKHSTKCSISGMALGRMERSWSDEEMSNVKPYYLDLLSHRDISNKISDIFNVPHQSPQLLIIKNGESIYDSSHMAINYHEVKKMLKVEFDSLK